MHKQAPSSAAQEQQSAAFISGVREQQSAAALHDVSLDFHLDYTTAMSTDIAADAAMSVSDDLHQCKCLNLLSTIY